MNADFTFWGHNCFLVETDREALLLDPWLNDTGAFFGSWHQWPPNGHLRPAVLKRCAEKRLSIFLSHEHQDHFDQATLATFSVHPDCTVFIPAYKDRFLFDALDSMGLNAVELAEGQVGGKDIPFKLYIDDSGINHDAAIFVAAPGFTFFNQNDCKIFDRLPLLAKELPPIDYYSVQFSGANWHPSSFVLPDEQRRLVAKKKVLSKLRNVAGGIKILSPRFFVPAAGPAFFPFLAPALNAGTGTIFVHQHELDKYLAQNSIRNVLYLRPGERVDEDASRVPVPGPTPAEIEQYVLAHDDVWASLDDNFVPARLAEVLQRRLGLIAGISLPPDTPSIAFRWGGEPTECLVIDLVANALRAGQPPAPPCLELSASTKYFGLMCGRDRWQDIALSLRATIERKPDVYNTIVNIFLFADESNLAESLLRNLNLSKERIVIHHQGEQYEINRYCPHQGGDLAFAVIDDDLHVVCPRHSWRFDLACEGMCKTSGMSIDAVRLGGAPEKSGS